MQKGNYSVNLEEIQKTFETIKPHIKTTNLIYAEKLSQITNQKIYLKLENLQKSGSFKIRGALNKIQKIVNTGEKPHLIAASAGNHAQGVAAAATQLGLKSTIVMPFTTPLAKINATINYGGEVILHGSYFDDALSHSLELAKKHNWLHIHPYDDFDIISGQGTIGLEIYDVLKEIDYCLVPVGGGGLLSGIGIALKSLVPNIKMIGVEVANFNSFEQAWKLGKTITINGKNSIADGISVKKIGNRNFEILKTIVDDVITVSELETAEAMLFLLEQCKVVAEGAGAVTTAALLSNKIKFDKPHKNVVAIVSGGNLDITTLEQIINAALIHTNRRIHFAIKTKHLNITLIDVVKIIKDENATIHNIDTTTTRNDLDITQYKINITLNTINVEQIDKIIAKLLNKGYELLIEQTKYRGIK